MNIIPSKQKGRNIIGGVNFRVSIHFQEHASWQGVIEWENTGQRLHFRSELEMLALIHEAVTDTQVAEDKIRSWHGQEKVRVL